MRRRLVSFARAWVALAPLLVSGGALAAQRCAVFELEDQVGFPTGEWQLLEHSEPCHPERNHLLARRGAEIRALPTARALLALLPELRNEVEALALASFLSDKSALLSDYPCRAVKLAPAGAPAPGRDEPDTVPLALSASEPVVRVDPYALSVSRKGPTGPFIVERYQRCRTDEGRFVLARETFGAKGRYERAELRVLQARAEVSALVPEPPPPPPPEGFVARALEMETRGYTLWVPRERSAKARHLLARSPGDEIRVEQVPDFARFVRIRNEVEALRYVRLLDSLQGILPGLDCYDPVKTPGELLTDRLHPQPTRPEGSEKSDLKLSRPPPEVRIDRARIRLGRAEPHGPFLVERYLLCAPPGRKPRLVFARETVGHRGEYERAERETLAEGDLR